MKSIKIKNIISAVLAVFFIFAGTVSCSNLDVSENEAKSEETVAPSTEQTYETGTASIKMFVPDYYAMAKIAKSSRAVAPQTYSVRLSAYNSISGNWNNLETVLLSDCEKTEATDVPEGFSGSVYKIVFTKVYAKSYEKDSLKVTLLDSNGGEIASGTNATAVTVKSGSESADTTFYTVPLSYSDGETSLSSGQMKFKRFVLAANTKYTLHVDVSGSVYPDVAVFDENGVFKNYYSVSDADSSRIVFAEEKERTVKYIGVWADEGAVTKYTLGMYTDLADFDFKDSSIGFWAGESYQINLAPVPSDAYLGTPVYTSSNDAITVSEDGVITADEEAEGTVTVTCGDVSHEIAVNVYESATELTGVLSGDLLHWTKEASPYKVTGNVLVEENTELTVDAGVKVYFAGNFYIKMNGTVAANGTKDEPIVFTKAASYSGTWGGITVGGGDVSVVNTYTYSSGNIFKNCEFSYAGSEPLTLNAGTFVDSCKFTDNSSYVYVTSTSYLMNSYFEQGIHVQGWGNYSLIVNNKIKKVLQIRYADADAKILNNTITDADVYFYTVGGFEMSANDFVSSTFGFYMWDNSSWSVTGNNFDCSALSSSVILDFSGNSYSDCKSVDFTGNYWGESETAELISAQESGEKNLSFINDYYDDFEKTKVDYSGWVSSKLEGTGYLGDGFIAFVYTINGYDFESDENYPETTDTTLAIAVTPKYHVNDISYIRVAQGYENLSSADWQTYSDSISFTADKENLVSGFAPIYVQLKDSEGNVSSAVCHKVPFDSPVIVTSLTDGNSYTSATTSITYSFGATDGGSISSYYVMLDGVKIRSGDANWGPSWTFFSAGKLGLVYMAARSHLIILSVTDSAGNTTTADYTFTITRADSDKSGLSGTSWDAATGQPLKDDRTVYLWHLDTDGSEATDTTATISCTSTDGGLNGAASCVSTIDSSDSISLDLSESNAFTVEYWSKYYLTIEEDGVFRTGVDNYDSANNRIRPYMKWYYTTSSGSVTSADLSSSYIDASKWHYWAYVFNGSYAAIYCDGVLLTYTDELSVTLNSNDNNLYIYGNSSGSYDEIRISSAARSGDEIAAYYNAAKDLVQ